MKPPFVRSAYNYDREQASEESGLKCLDKTLAQQQFAEECDINTIVDRFHLTGEVPQLTELPSYQAFEEVFDFQSAMNAVRQAQEQFMSLPAPLRARFHNDPQEFLAFTTDDKNLAEAQKLGLLSPEAIARIQKEQEDRNALKEKEIIEKHEAQRDKTTKDKK